MAPCPLSLWRFAEHHGIEWFGYQFHGCHTASCRHGGKVEALFDMVQIARAGARDRGVLLRRIRQLPAHLLARHAGRAARSRCSAENAAETERPPSGTADLTRARQGLRMHSAIPRRYLAACT